jgi:hypothetical protein
MRYHGAQPTKGGRSMNSSYLPRYTTDWVTTYQESLFGRREIVRRITGPVLDDRVSSESSNGWQPRCTATI